MAYMSIEHSIFGRVRTCILQEVVLAQLGKSVSASLQTSSLDSESNMAADAGGTNSKIHEQRR